MPQTSQGTIIQCATPLCKKRCHDIVSSMCGVPRMWSRVVPTLTSRPVAAEKQSSQVWLGKENIHPQFPIVCLSKHVPSSWGKTCGFIKQQRSNTVETSCHEKQLHLYPAMYSHNRRALAISRPLGPFSCQKCRDASKIRADDPVCEDVARMRSADPIMAV